MPLLLGLRIFLGLTRPNASSEPPYQLTTPLADSEESLQTLIGSGPGDRFEYGGDEVGTD